MTRLVVGCMTGTSIDALDAALVRITGHGLEMRPEFVDARSTPLGELADELRRLADQAPMTAMQIAGLNRRFSLVHARAITELLAGRHADLVCVHGQTVAHAPPLSWQLLQPAIIARALGVPVVSDLRAMDLAAGGQGAPITPIADAILCRRITGPWAVVNLGGFCNITLGPDPIAARDVCACNQILDHTARTLMGRAFDDGGEVAASGSLHRGAAAELANILHGQSAARRSLGTGDEGLAWVGRWSASLSAADVAASACEAIGATIGAGVRGRAAVLVAGGGVKNLTLLSTIAKHAGVAPAGFDRTGVPAEWREAAEFAILGALCQDRVPITLPGVTGVARPPVAGCWVY